MPRDPKIRMKTLTVEKPKHPFDPFGKPEYDIPNAARFVTMPEIEVTGQATGKPAGKDGHEGTTLAQVPRPDREVRHEPGRCGQCGAGLGDGRSPEWSAFPSPATGAPWRGSAGTAMRASARCVVP
jgi:hypothetical protein